MLTMTKKETITTMELPSLHSEVDNSTDLPFLGVPEELRARPQWVAWKYVPDPNRPKPTKVPYSPLTGERARPNDPATWGTFEQALALYHQCGMGGIGYVFSAEDPYAGVDLDKCREPATGAIDPGAQLIITALNSYTEVSSSGTGVHLILRGKLRPGGRRKGRIELYDSGRYFAMTGEHRRWTPRTIEPRQGELDAFHQLVWFEHNGAAPLSDKEVLRLAIIAQNGAKFSRLYWGDDTSGYDGYPSRSEADQALCSMLA